MTVKPRKPARERITKHRPIPRDSGMPMIARIALAIAVVALGGVVLFAGQGGLKTVVTGVTAAFTGFVDKVTATPSPSPTTAAIPLTVPTLDAPVEPYTNQPAVDVTGSIPLQFLGQEGIIVRLYVTPPEGETTFVAEQPIADRASFVFAGVELVDGPQEFTATLATSDENESDPSAPITFVLDQSKPKITISSPKNKAIVNGKTATLKGKTQGRSTLLARNGGNGATATATAEPDGTFMLVIAIEGGSNAITVTATDPAGNEGEAKITIRRGSGKLTATLRANRYEFSRRDLPDPITMTVTVTNPDGRPVDDADVTFTLSVPGLETVVSDATTDSKGKATFKTTIPRGASRGSGTITALVDAGDLGNVTARHAITIVR
jgi:hypothetical protein